MLISYTQFGGLFSNKWLSRINLITFRMKDVNRTEHGVAASFQMNFRICCV